MGHKYNVLKRIAQSGRLMLLVTTFFQMLRTWYLGGSYFVFKLSPDEVAATEALGMERYQFENISEYAQLSDSDRDQLAQFKINEFEALQSFLDKGGRLWVARTGGKIVTYGGARWGKDVPNWFFPLSPQWILLTHFKTLESYRGKGLFGAIMRRIIEDSRRQGATLFLVHCDNWNRASRQAIEKSGFRLIGSASMGSKKHFSYFHKITSFLLLLSCVGFWEMMTPIVKNGF